MTARPAVTPPQLLRVQDAAKLLAVYVKGRMPVRTVIDGERIIIEPVAVTDATTDPFDAVDLTR